MLKKIKRPLITVLIIIVCFLLQCTVFQQLSFASISPNLLIIVTASFGVMRGRKEGMWVGFLCGIITDVFFGDLIGFYALFYTILGYANGFFKRIFYPEDIKLPLILIGASDFLLGNAVCILMFIMRSKFHYWYYMGNIIIPELIYTTLVTLVLYQIILKVNQKLESEEKRSASKFV